MSTLIDHALQGGKYRLDKELEQDDFGVTFQATHHHFDKIVLIKTLNEASQQAPNFAERRHAFQDEARRLTRCGHPNLVKMLDHFVEGGFPYVVMESIPGRTLQDTVFPNRPLSEAVAIRYIRQIGEALTLIHQNGLLHRDITPNHIVIQAKTQEPVLLEFGLARGFLSESAQTQTRFMSSGGYAAIEQSLAQARLTPATDVYGLAATLYAVLTAKAPVTAMRQDHQPLPPPRYLRPELTPEVNQAVLSGMGLEPSDRPSTVAEWLSLLPSAEATHPSPSIRETPRSLTVALSPVGTSRYRVRPRPQGTQTTPQLMAGIVPTTGLDRRWLTFGAMLFGGVLTLFATIALLLKFYLPEPVAPLPAASADEEGSKVPLWEEVGIPTLKQQSPTPSSGGASPNPPNASATPFSYPLQPLIDQAPIPELLFEDLAPLAEDLPPPAAEAAPTKAPKDLDELEAFLEPTDAPPSASSQSLEDSDPSTSEDMNPASPSSADETPPPDPDSTRLSAPTSPQTTGSPGNSEVSSENPEVSPESAEVSPESAEVSPENPE